RPRGAELDAELPAPATGLEEVRQRSVDPDDDLHVLESRRPERNVSDRRERTGRGRAGKRDRLTDAVGDAVGPLIPGAPMATRPKLSIGCVYYMVKDM